MAAPLKILTARKPRLTSRPSTLANLPGCEDPHFSASAYTMAFQPIVDLLGPRVLAYEALVRGLENQSAARVFEQVSTEQRPAMDKRCRVMAVELAVSLGLLATGAALCINFNPNAIQPSIPALEQTLAAAVEHGLPLSRVILEITETESLRDPDRLRSLLLPYRKQGLRTALDDFGAGYAGLSTLAAFQPDILKIDIALTRSIHERHASRSIVRGIAQICADLDIHVIAEGIEEQPQVDTLQDLGIHCMQGNLFAAPAFEALPSWP